jgi:hypothetical protein
MQNKAKKKNICKLHEKIPFILFASKWCQLSNIIMLKESKQKNVHFVINNNKTRTKTDFYAIF